ncbi:hypothetical protein GCM10022380_87590 [Amycolatopsis tucumanensis]|uniref:HTH arsR-type domain-containing protein n=2 Tax=Amycolatopsis tucumanensis TaxID=401106 RepID=A0ABP7JX27_9PSEU
MPNFAHRATTEAAITRAAAEPSAPQIAAAAATFALLSSPPRLYLVWLITHGSYDVGTLAKRVGISIATASQHLAKLRLVGVVTARREGRRHLYASANSNNASARRVRHR